MQKRKIYQLEKELNSIKEQIEYSIKSTQGLILTSTESVPIKELVKSINSLLNSYYSGQVNYKKQKETMQQVMTNISHDLRTPLTVLSGYIEILEEKSSKIDMPEEIVVIIHKLSIKIKNSVRLINQFFNLAQIESGDMKYDIKKYNITSLCNDVSMHVVNGEIYGLVGPNGAGKSTMLRMLLNLTKPNMGEFMIDGVSVQKNGYQTLRKVGAIIENPYFYEQLTGRENLELHCEYMGYPNLEEIDKVLGLVSLKNIDGKYVSQYSIGMKQRLAIARAILTRPEILILDEPINGLDPDGIIEIRRLIQELNKEHEITVIISSHILSEMELLADTVGIMKDGNMIQEISMKDIHEQNAAYIEIETDNAEKAGYILDEILQIKQFRVISDGIIQVFDLSKSGKEISSALMKYGIGVESIQKKQNSLEEFFFKTTRRSLD